MTMLKNIIAIILIALIIPSMGVMLSLAMPFPIKEGLYRGCMLDLFVGVPALLIYIAVRLIEE